MSDRKGISSFSVLLLMAVSAVVGISCFSMLKVQYLPSAAGKSITVSYFYPGASARIVEAEVTSPLEGIMSTIKGCTGISSLSDEGGGSITISVEDAGRLEAIRFEIASRIRNIYPSLPEACSYPSISLNTRGESARTAITFNILSPLPSKDIAHCIEDYLVYPLSTIDGVSNVTFTGDTEYEMVVTFDAEKAEASGISASDIAVALSSYFSDALIGLIRNGEMTYAVKLRNLSSQDLSSLPVKKVEGHMVYLSEIASWRYQEALPTSYFRINGLNTLFLNVEASSDANIIEVVENVRDRITEAKKQMPEEIDISVGYDYSEYVSNELAKIYFRTLLCLAILLVFVFIVNRSWRYMLVIAVTLVVNILLSVALYYVLGLHIHIYTLAGITVSLGIIIDNSIVMIDHYSRYYTRSVFPALLCAVATTVVSLLSVLLLPESERVNLTDFSLVIIINLVVSLLVSYLFVPALLDYFPIPYAGEQMDADGLRRMSGRQRIYRKYIAWGVRHRWVYIVVFVAAFGIPTCLIPKDKVGWEFYKNHKNKIDKWIGSSIALFDAATERFDFYREPQRSQLTINAGMPEGCTVQQLNEIVRSMENYLAQFEEVEVFETRVNSYRDARISVLFKPQYENSSAPLVIKSNVISMATNFGGANWSVYGIDDRSFNNNVLRDFKTYGISLKGYNYDELMRYGEYLVSDLSANPRVSGAEIWGGGSYDMPLTEFGINYDFETLTSHGINPYEYFSAIQSPLFESYVGRIPVDGEYVKVRLSSSAKEDFDIWHVENKAVYVGDGKMKLSEAGRISKEKTGLPIRKDSQSYIINVNFDFIGSDQLARSFMEDETTHMNSDILPLGFRAESRGGGWFYSHKEQYAWLILLVIACIYVILAVHFNSLRYPLSVIFMAPISFIGVFLSFGLSEFTFDKGGFAAFIMLTGITVNAGIYLVSEWRNAGKIQGEEGLKEYVRVFGRKKWPISLTILSTILGLVPFMFDGPGEVFWFAFALGTISGLAFSVIALVLFLPVFVIPRRGLPDR